MLQKKLMVGESWTSRAKLRKTGGKTLRFYEIVKKKSETPEFEFSLRGYVIPTPPPRFIFSLSFIFFTQEV